MKKKPPSTLGPDGQRGRDSRGRFQPGNKLGRGNPLAGRAAKIRAILLEAMSEERATALAEKLIDMALSGDLASIRELLDRTVGKASPSELLERVERLEILLEETRK